MPRPLPEPGWTLADWRRAYADGLDPEEALAGLVASQAGRPEWITPPDAARLRAQLDHLALLLERQGGDRSRLPLYGIPFAVKDNIDAAGFPTTAACPAYSYDPPADAFVVARLREAGAVVVGKSNLDQFATGLSGARSPYGFVPNAFRGDYIAGGSSSGSGALVARGAVPFALGTDTAGSGRVPAAFGNIVGLKPTRGRLSTTGVVPACRTLDCVTVFALTVADADFVARIAEGFDAADPYSRRAPGARPGFGPNPRLLVPEQPEFFGDARAEAAFAGALRRAEEIGCSLERVDFAPFSELAALLYEGPWVAERYTVIEELLRREPDAVHPVVRGIIEGGARPSAADAFRAEYRRAALARRIAETLARGDALLVPTTPSIYARAEMEADPVRLNARLGTYTNFTNLADLSALALPGGFRADGLPAGVTVIAPAWRDDALAEFGARWEAALALPRGATGRPYAEAVAPSPRGLVRLAVVGAHLTGMPLNRQLASRGARRVAETRTAPTYRLYALANTTPPKPGLVRAEGGASIVVEVWELSEEAFGSFTAEVPAPLGIGNVVLEDGSTVKGFICEPAGLAGAEDITAHGGWKAYLGSKA